VKPWNLPCLIVVACGLVWTQPAWSQQDRAVAKRRARVARPAPPSSQPSAGFWPTDRLVEYFILRIAESVSEQYNLDEQQAAEFERMTLRRWKPFVRRIRPMAQPLLNRYLETKYALTPPSKQTIQQWAKQARPVLEAVRKELQEAQREFGKILKPEQKPKFERDVLKFSMAAQAIDQKLRQWEQGKFEEYEWWDPTWRVRQERRRRREAARAAARAHVQAPQERPGSGPVETVVEQIVPLDKWERFVEQFIIRYRLDEGQRTTARSILKDLKERALAYRQRHADEFATIDRKLAGAEASERQELLDRRRELNGPIQDMFEELRDRLDGLLTSAQRQLGQEGPE